MKKLNESIEINSFLNKLDKYREDNIILLEVLITIEDYIRECFNENKVTVDFFIKGLNIIRSCEEELNTIEESYINFVLIKKKQNITLQNKINDLLNELRSQVKQNLITYNVYESLKKYIDFAQGYYLSEVIY
ncbi:hypothetical protein [Selenihalanaerobacter shriftii]|uniref:Uncharacterized protein n=1 Tax=Selenihalanaerobacter shriftii TaxID=142842 RepID=A0A1T4L5J1_9FIRM|nr:hypothetical protein [Selenihalanaerobacter shriftii]SJZ49817.1 hypothetical protein SAMN02745118_01044 [Selenihalanaerobacter shriftii]